MKRKGIFLVVFLFLLTGAGLFASSDHTSTLDINYTFGRQYIFYDNQTVYNNKTTSGMGGGFEYSYVLKPHSTSIGFGTSFEFYRFSGFHDYLDVKVSANLKQHLFTIDSVDFDIAGGVGVDFVFREDGDKGLYFLGRLGLDVVLPGTETFDVVVHTGGEFTTQKGSWLFHLNGSAGFRWKFGGD